MGGWLPARRRQVSRPAGCFRQSGFGRPWRFVYDLGPVTQVQDPRDALREGYADHLPSAILTADVCLMPHRETPMEPAQSGAILLLRAFIMLASFIALPALAVLGVPKSSEVLRLAEEGWQLVSTLATQAIQEQLHSNSSQRKRTQPLESLQRASAPKLPADPSVLAGTEFPLSTPTDLGSAFPHPDRYSGAPAQLAQSSFSGPEIPETGEPSRFDSLDQESAIKAELQTLGCRSCVLESWGEQGELYRFQVKMALIPGEGASSYSHRFFSAVAGDATSAMREVLDEVKVWRVEQAQRDRVLR